MATVPTVCVYPNAKLGVRYVYGSPVPFPFLSDFADSERNGSARDQLAATLKRHSDDRDEMIAKLEAAAEAESAR
jgi:hypothetical protein